MANQRDPTTKQRKRIFGITLAIIFIWLFSVAISREPTFSWSMDPSIGPDNRYDYTRTTMRTYQSGTQSAWRGKHTVILLLTAIGTYMYWKKFMN